MNTANRHERADAPLLSRGDSEDMDDEPRWRIINDDSSDEEFEKSTKEVALNDSDDDEKNVETASEAKKKTSVRKRSKRCRLSRAIASVTRLWEVGLASVEERCPALSTDAEKRLERYRKEMNIHLNQVVEIGVIGTETLRDVPDLVHPIVRVHIVDARTGHYLSTDSGNPAITTQFETQRKIQFNADISTQSINFILPVATAPAHLKGHGMRPVWNESFVIDICLDELLRPEALVLFELCDFQPIKKKKHHQANSSIDCSNGLYGIAWAGFQPIHLFNGQPQVFPSGTYLTQNLVKACIQQEWPMIHPKNLSGAELDAKNFMIKDTELPQHDAHALMVQKRNEAFLHLFRLDLYEFIPLSNYAQQQACDLHLLGPPSPASSQIPQVYCQYMRRKWRSFGGSFIHARVRGIPRPEPTQVERRPRIPMESQVIAGSLSYNNKSSSSRKIREDPRAVRASRRARFPHECNIMPERMLCHIYPGDRGTSRISFSPTGRLLAVATNESFECPIRIYDATSAPNKYTWAHNIIPRTGAQQAEMLGTASNMTRDGAILLFELEAHVGSVVDMQWTNDDRFLLSCGNDGNVALWDLADLAVKASQEERLFPAPPIMPFLKQMFVHVTHGVLCCAFIVGLENTKNDDPDASDEQIIETVNPLRPTVQAFLEPNTLPDLTARTAIACITSGHDGILRLWQLSNANYLGRLGGDECDPHHGAPVNALQVDPRSGRIFTADSQGLIVLWRRADKQKNKTVIQNIDFGVLRSISHPQLIGRPIISIALHPRRRRIQLIVVPQDDCATLLDVTTNALVTWYIDQTLSEQHLIDDTRKAIFSPDGLHALVAARDTGAMIFDAARGTRQNCQILDELDLITPISDLAWHPIQHIIAIASVGTKHPILILCADRPNNPIPIVPAAAAAEQDADRRATILREPDHGEKRRRRLKDLQERRAAILQKIADRKKKTSSIPDKVSPLPPSSSLFSTIICESKLSE